MESSSEYSAEMNVSSSNETVMALLKNRSEVSDEYTPYDQRPETYFVPVLFFIIFVVGVVGNGTLVVIFLKHRTMRNVPNTYILSLALADLFVIVTTVPFTSTIYTVDSWPWGEAMCKLTEFGKDISIGVSIFTLTALSADRFFAIVDPLKKLHSSGAATRITISITVSIWILAVICALPSVIGSYLRHFDDNSTVPGRHFEVCYPFPLDWGQWYPRAIILARFVIFYALPLTIIGIFYAQMAMHLVRSTKMVPGELQGAQRQIRARKKVAVTVLVFVVVFAICFFPTHLFMLWFYFWPTSQEDYNGFWHYLRIMGFCLGYLNSCVNPIALYCVSGTFRKHFDRYLLCRDPARSRTNTCQAQYATSMTMTTTRRNYSINTRNRCLSTVRRPDLGQETSITLINNDKGDWATEDEEKEHRRNVDSFWKLKGVY